MELVKFIGLFWLNFLSPAVGFVREGFKGSMVQRFKVRLRKVLGGCN